MSVFAQILAIYENLGASEYFGEPVSMTEHALQAAHFARAEQAPAELVVAALLHDIGHLLEPVPNDIADWKVDARHEQVGSRWLGARMVPTVAAAVRLHVPAKRYLCATDAGYGAKLSPASVVTLELQGGPMSAQEVSAFEREPFHREALRVRRWDDLGKVPDLQTASLRDYRALIESVLK